MCSNHVRSTAAATAALVGQAVAAPADAFVEACFEMTGGNPLLVTELLRALAAEGVSGTAEDATRARAIGPEPIARGVRATLARLGADCTALAHAVSVLGDAADARVAAELAGGLSPQRTAVALAGLQDAGLMASGDRLAFTHPLLGRAVYDGLAAARRGELHRQSAELLYPAGVASATAAHLLLAPGRGESWAVDALRRAAEEAEDRAAPSVSSLLLSRALDEPPDPLARPGIEAEAALSAARAGDRDAPAAIEAALDTRQDAVPRSQLTLALAKTLYQHGRMDAAVAACERGLAEADDGDPLALELEAAWAAAALWSSSGGSEHVATRLAAIIESEAPARGVGERDLLAGRAGVALVEGTDRAEVLRLARRAWGGGAYLDDGNAGAPTLGALVAALLRSGAALESLEVCDELIADARRRASPLDYATWRTSRGRTLWYLGRLDEAESDLEEALDARAIGWELAVPLAVEAMVSVLVEQDRRAAARAVLEDLGDVEETLGSGPLWAVVRSARGRLAMAENDPETALSEFLAVGRQATDALGTSNPAVSPWRSEAALALHRLGRSDEAQEHAAAETREARRFGAPRALSQALRVEAIVRGGADGLALAREAGSVATAEHPLEVAHAYVTEGTLLRTAGDRPGAQKLLRLGMDEAAACGARALVATARHELTAAGARPRRERSTGADALTASERRIASLAADGRTSREIADALFVTPRTVAFHLSNTYAKLGITGRAELTDALAATNDEPADDWRPARSQ